MAAESLTVRHRFRGPARSGNGGYTAGLLAARVDSGGAGTPITVTLRRPPPLDTSLDVATTADGGVELRDGTSVVAVAGAGAFAGEVVEAVDFDTATRARSAYRGATQHPFPECFVCGPERTPADGMRLAPGLLQPGRTACVWLPDPSCAGADPARALPELGWAALDCPGGWTTDLGDRPVVLGRMTAYALPVLIGRPHVVVGRLLRVDGRKTFTATAMYDDGRLVGRAEQTWIAVDPAAFEALG